jgi:hypothetical protein
MVTVFRCVVLVSILGGAAIALPGCERCAGMTSERPEFDVRVADAEGAPVLGAAVRIGGADCIEAAEEGLYLCPAVEVPSPLTLVVTADGFAEHTEQVYVEEGGDRLCPYTTNIVLVDVVLQPG